MLILKDFKGREHHLDPTAPVFTVQKDLTGDTIVTRAEAYVSHFSTCPKALEANRSTS